LAKTQPEKSGKARERLIAAAYDLFAADGVSQVGVDAILKKSGCAKGSLYTNFESKVALAIAFMDRREKLWTRDWLESTVKSRTADPEGRLLAIFDVFDGWFQKKTFEGCSFINVLLESKPDSALHHAASVHLLKIREIIRGLGVDAGLAEPERFAQAWHMLMKGSIISAQEGNRGAARDAGHAARLILSNWKRV
jgi:AcrR family transcriptional regulator